MTDNLNQQHSLNPGKSPRDTHDVREELSLSLKEQHEYFPSTPVQQPHQVPPNFVDAFRPTNPISRISSSRSAVIPPYRNTMSLMSAKRGSNTNSKATPLTRQQSLGDYFSIEEIPRVMYMNSEFVKIARLLKEAGLDSWSSIPRIYTVLRLTGQLLLLDMFLDQGISDLWLPLSISQLPPIVSNSQRARYMESQDLVLTKAVDLENTNVKRNTQFKKGESFPMTIKESLGKAHMELCTRSIVHSVVVLMR